METKELTTNNFNFIAPTNFDDLQRLAKMMMASGFFKDAADVAKCGVKIMAGQELGIGPVAACTHIYFIQGRLAYEASILGAAIKNKGYDYRVTTSTDKECAMTFLNKRGEEIGKTSYTWSDAEKAGLTGKDNYKKHPVSMMFSRCLTRGIRMFCPDVFGGNAAYTPDELGAEISSSGSYVEDKKAPEIIWKGAMVSDEAKAMTEMFTEKKEEQEVLI